MPSILERLSRLKANPRNHRASEVIALLEGVGAERRKKGSSHHTYTYPGMWPLTVPFHNEHQVLLEYATKQVVQWVEEILEREAQ